MMKIFEHANDLHVRTVVVFGKAADHTLWADAEFEVALVADEVADAFEKGMLVINDNEVMKKPVALNDGAYVTVETVSNAAALVEWSLGEAN